MDPSEEAVASLLEDLGYHEGGTVDDLFARVYEELKDLARGQRRRWHGDHTLNTTALVHELYVKLAGRADLGSESRAHFRALAARAMRQVLCNYARGRNALKRGGAHEHVPAGVDAGDLEPITPPSEPSTAARKLHALDAALDELEKVRLRASRVVECRFFGGMTVEETAVALGASPRSVKRDWAMAQAWLHARLEAEEA